MTQLKDDCFAFGDALIPIDDALTELKNRLHLMVKSEQVSLNYALNRTLAKDLIANRNVPPHDNSAVDGYTVNYNDLSASNHTRLPVTGRIVAGDSPKKHIITGQATRIFTGAKMPKGADTVFMEEDCQKEGKYVIFPPGLKAGSNRRRAGEDIKKGSTIISAGERLRPQEIGLAASIGCSQLKVFKRLKAAIFSTGREIRDPTQRTPESCIFDANRFSVHALLKNLGVEVTDMGILPDDKIVISQALKKAAKKHDLLITSGGVSNGEEDHVKDAVKLNGSINLWRLAIKPGRPIALGQVSKTPFIGLPGNPVAAMVTFMFIARPIILKLAGRNEIQIPRHNVIANFNYKKKKGRREWVRVCLSHLKNYDILAQKPVSSGAGILTSMVNADGLIELPEPSAGIVAGDTVKFLSFEDMMQ